MKNEKLLRAIGEIEDDLVCNAVHDTGARKRTLPLWAKWGALAACLCLLLAGALTIPRLRKQPSQNEESMAQVYTLPQAETMRVELAAWSGDHFTGVVVDAGDNSIFPAGAELSVVFDYDTEILLDDGAILRFNPDEPDTDAIGWRKGTIVTVRFVNYEEYQEGNHFYNQVYASHVEAEA